MTAITFLPERIQPMSEYFLTPLLISINLVLGVITLNDYQIAVAILGAVLMLLANLPKAIMGVDFAARYIFRGFRLPTQNVVVAAPTVPQPDNQDEPDIDGNDDDFLKKNSQNAA